MYNYKKIIFKFYKKTNYIIFIFIFFILYIINFISKIKFKKYNKYYILKYINIINKIIEFPNIIITHIIMIIIYTKIKNNHIYENIINMSKIPFLSLIIKIIMKKIFNIQRPFTKIIKNKKKINKISKWIIKIWKKKRNNSFPSGHSLYTIYWNIILTKNINYKNYSIIILINLIFYILTIYRIIILLHNHWDIYISLIINIILINYSNIKF